MMICSKLKKLSNIKEGINKREALVHWLGWPEQFDSWIPITQHSKKLVNT